MISAGRRPTRTRWTPGRSAWRRGARARSRRAPRPARRRPRRRPAADRDDQLGHAFGSRAPAARPTPKNTPITAPRMRADDRDDHRLPPDHPLHLPAAHPDRAQQTQLACAFEDRQAERVHDAEERDQDRQREERRDQTEELIDEPRLLFAEGRLVLDLDVAELFRRCLDRRVRPAGIRSRARASPSRTRRAVRWKTCSYVSSEIDVVAADDAVLRERPADHERRLPDRWRTPRGSGRRPSILRRAVSSSTTTILPSSRACDRPGGQLERRHLLDRRGVDRGDERASSP